MDTVRPVYSSVQAGSWLTFRRPAVLILLLDDLISAPVVWMTCDTDGLADTIAVSTL